MKQNRYVSKTVEQYSDPDFPPSGAAECVAWFAKVFSDIPEEYRAGASIDISSETAYDSPHATVTVSYYRPETDEEEADREAKERARADKQRAEELRQLAALQAKYGTN